MHRQKHTTHRGASREKVKNKAMTTTEIAKQNKTKYFIEYVCDDLRHPYYQLVRAKDAAILAAYDELITIYAECYVLGINKNDVSLW